jgi:hypothetical protein
MFFPVLIFVCSFVLLFSLIRNLSRSWRRRRRYQKRIAAAEIFWENLKIKLAPADSLYIIATLTDDAG